MASSSYKLCTVPCCTSTTIKYPNKLFIHVPQPGPLRKKWLQLARRDPSTVSPKSSIYFCEDHFDLPNDMENYMEYHIMGSVSAIRMKPSCVPTKFECQPDRLKRTATTMPRSAVIKRQRASLIEEILAQGTCSPSTSSIELQHSNIETAESENTQNKEAMEPLMKFCVCCLVQEVPFIHLSTCSHSEFLNNFMKPAIKSSSQVVCYKCHSILKKIKLFTLQVKNSFKHITEESHIEISNQKNGNLKMQKLKNIDIPQTSIDSDINKTIDSKEITNQTPEMIIKPKSLKAYERKIKNIGNALKIIESNQNISNANVGSRNTENIILKTENLMEVDKKTIDMVDHVLGAEGKFGIKKNIFVDKIDKELEIPSKSTTKKKVDTYRGVSIYSMRSRIKTVSLSNEELIEERSKMAASQTYMKSLYKCEACLLGFNYEENLQDHVKRKHFDKDSGLKCDVCQQTLNPGASYNDHMSNHYTRCRVLFVTYLLLPPAPTRYQGKKFEEWLERRHGVLTFRLTQVLTGHGSFGRFLFRIQREETPECRHCEDHLEDTVEHTVAAMVGSERNWDAVSSFCEAVMLAKTEAARVREQSSSSGPSSRNWRHYGRRGSREV
ncbi:unnamed protein product [Spodoptera exigua]|nr:unnamed protein product [Spodoptera exigua]